MKANPNVIKMAQEQMAKMSPEQMKQASDLAQKQMEAMNNMVANPDMQQRIAALKDDPEFQDFFQDVQKNGPGAMMKYSNDAAFLKKLNDKLGGEEAIRQAVGGSIPVDVPGGVDALEAAQEWEEIEMAVDSGASATVIGGHQVKSVTATNPRPDIKYEVADGSHIPNMGEKDFAAFTDCGSLRRITAQLTEVKKTLPSEAKLVQSGHRAVFDPAMSYIEHCESGEWFPLEENNGTYALRLWINRIRKALSGGQAQ